MNGAFCRRSRPRVPLPPVPDVGCDVSKKNSDEASRWDVQFARLVVYKAEHGDCSVPQRWAEDPRLGSWVSTQRYGKRKHRNRLHKNELYRRVSTSATICDKN